MSQTSELLRQHIVDAGVWQKGHLVLNSGRHSDVKLDMERLTLGDNRRGLKAVMAAVADELFALEVDGAVPVPNGALKLARQSFPLQLPQIIPAEKLGKREFAIQDDWARRFVQRSGRLAIFEDVVTTGGASLAMMRTVRSINPDVELDLVGIWRRDELDAEVDNRFASQSFLIEEPIPAWTAEDCEQCQQV